MIKIYSEVNKYYFYQWELNQRLLITDDEINEVEFSQQTSDNALVCEVYTEDGNRLVDVPNILLQNAWKLKVYAICGDNCKTSMEFVILPRCKPSDYIYTETEIKRYEDLEDRIENLEQIDLTNYATKVYVDTATQTLETRVNAAEEKNSAQDTSLAEISDRVEVLENMPVPEATANVLNVNITAGKYDIYSGVYQFNEYTIDKDIEDIINAYNSGTVIKTYFTCDYKNENIKAYLNIIDIFEYTTMAGNTNNYILFNGILDRTIQTNFLSYIRLIISYDKNTYNYRINSNVERYKDGNTDTLPNEYALKITDGNTNNLYEYDGRKEIEIVIPKIENSWDNMKNKPFYKVDGGYVLDETTYDIVDGGMAPITTQFQLAENVIYIVNYNGIEYECNAISTLIEGISVIALGNIGVITGSDINDMPFIVLYTNEGTDEGIYGIIMDLSGSAECVVSIQSVGDIKYIDAEVLPAATETTKGGVIVGEGLVINDGVISIAPELLAKLNS